MRRNNVEDVRRFDRATVLRLLSQAEACMETWPDTEKNKWMRGAISVVLSSMRDRIDDVETVRADMAGRSYRAITDAGDTMDCDAGRLVLEAIKHYRGPSVE